MKNARSRWLLLLAGLLVVVGLPLIGKWMRSRPEARCALDGLTIEPLYQVRIVDQAGAAHGFCCVRCAVAWLARQGEGAAAIYVTDEVSGEEIDAQSACFVHSAVATNVVTRNQVHVFRNRADAEDHVRVFGGQVLAGEERPF